LAIKSIYGTTAKVIMFYELRIALRTIRKEGFGPLFEKLRVYFGDRASAADFLRAPRPEPTPEAIMKFLWEAGNGVIAPGQSKWELAQLLNWIKQRPAPASVLEIGTARGGTLFCWCALAAPDATIISLDLPGGIHGGGYPPWKLDLYRRFAGDKQKIHLLRGDSHNQAMLEEVKKILPPGGLDFLFIDGDHTLAGVRSDYEMYSPLVKPGGAIIFHDIAVHRPEFDCHVDELWNQIKQGRKYWEFVEEPPQGMYGIGVILAEAR
jgi:predicted O-methyltransferase YrrM